VYIWKFWPNNRPAICCYEFHFIIERLWLQISEETCLQQHCYGRWQGFTLRSVGPQAQAPGFLWQTLSCSVRSDAQSTNRKPLSVRAGVANGHRVMLYPLSCHLSPLSSPPQTRLSSWPLDGPGHFIEPERNVFPLPSMKTK
jgi:hypothetical protein